MTDNETPLLGLFPVDGVWSTQDGNIIFGDLCNVFAAVRDGRERFSAFPDCSSNSDRRVNRATQLLRKAGYIEFAGGKWRLVVAREALP